MKNNKIINNLSPIVLNELPVTFKYVTTQRNARNEIKKKKQKLHEVSVEFYNVKDYRVYGYHKSISKIVNFPNEK